MKDSRTIFKKELNEYRIDEDNEILKSIEDNFKTRRKLN